MNQLKVGDVVQLKSGGPLMTVTGIDNFDGKNIVLCTWFVGTKKEAGSFPPDSLEIPSPRF